MINRISDVIQMVPTFTDKVHAAGPPQEILDSADAFLQQVPAYYRRVLTVENITINNSGTISLDWMVRKDFVSVEIGNGLVGFFCEMPDGINPEGTYVLDNQCPIPIVKALDKLYGRI